MSYGVFWPLRSCPDNLNRAIIILFLCFLRWRGVAALRKQNQRLMWMGERAVSVCFGWITFRIFAWEAAVKMTSSSSRAIFIWEESIVRGEPAGPTERGTEERTGWLVWVCIQHRSHQTDRQGPCSVERDTGSGVAGGARGCSAFRYSAGSQAAQRATNKGTMWLSMSTKWGLIITPRRHITTTPCPCVGQRRCIISPWVWERCWTVTGWPSRCITFSSEKMWRKKCFASSRSQKRRYITSSLSLLCLQHWRGNVQICKLAKTKRFYKGTLCYLQETLYFIWCTIF